MPLSDLKNLARFKDIVTLLTKYGFGEIVRRIDLPGVMTPNMVVNSKTTTVHTRIRCALEELGATFIKFGQVMSLRPDLLPPELLSELGKLQDDVPTMDLTDVKTVIEGSLGATVNEVFSVFDVEPIAAASLSQVHKGVLRREGKIVAIKVRRPGIKRMIEADLDILEKLADVLDQQFDGLAAYDLPELVQVVRRHLMTELDFKTEMRNMNIARSFAVDAPVYIPKGYDAYCTDEVVVMDYVQGARYVKMAAGSQHDRRRIAAQGLAAATKQILDDGFFHADPHPGNLLINEKMNLCIIDWGMVGRLTERDRFELTDLMRAIVDKDSEALMHSVLRLCQPRGHSTASQSSIERDLLTLLDTYHAVPIKQMNVGQLLLDIMSIVRDHQLRMPTEYVIMIKALVTAEGSARLMYPELNVVAEIRESVVAIAKDRFQPTAIWRQLRQSMTNLWAYQRDIPRSIQQIINKLDSGSLELQLNHNKLEALAHTIENASNRLTIAIIAGAIIMGSSMIITTGVGPHLLGFPALGVIGYSLSVILGLWLVYTIIRSGKP
ncbi:MAG: AarF/UbiB family protein [Desulfosarcina sp.]|jgi:ubiquinone biosynthesis protein